MNTLNDMISAAIGGADIEEAAAAVLTESAEAEKVASATPISGDIEKLASALEFVATQGVETFIKEAKSHHPALASNEAAIAYTSDARNKGSGGIDKELRALLSNAKDGAVHTAKSGKGRAPVKQLTKSASDGATREQLIREALAAKVAASIKEQV